MFSLAPGVGQCGLGIGAEPSDSFQLLMDWVENDETPEVMLASGEVGQKNLCLFPRKLTYTGQGEHDDASIWTCT